MKKLLAFALPAIMLTVVACGDDTDVTDDGQPADVVETAEPDSIDDTATPDTQVDPDVAEDTQNDPGPYVDGAFARLATQNGEIGGPNSTAVAGDILIQNKYVRFMIRNQEHGLYSPYGGTVIDADLAGDDRTNDKEQFHELFLMAGFARLFNPSQMEFVDDGTHSGTAWVQFKGTDGGMALIDSILPTTARNLDVTVDYILGPEDRFLTIKMTVRDPANSNVAVDIGQLLMFGNRGELFNDRCGSNLDCLSGKSNLRWLGNAADGVSYALTLDGDKQVSPLLSMDELMILSQGSVTIPKDGEVAATAYLAVGNGTIDDVLNTVWDIRDTDPGKEVTLNVTLSDSLTTMNDVFIKAKLTEETNKNGWVSATSPDSTGKALLHLQPGIYDFTLSIPGAPDTVLAAQEVTADGANTFDITAAAAGWAHVVVKDGADANITAAITFQSGHDASWNAGVGQYEAVRRGDRIFPILPGDYTATVSKGLAWSIDRQNVTVTAGQTTEIVATIDPAYDTAGHVMLNTHEHCERSFDSSVFPEDRIFNAAANGIQVMNPTDHDFMGNHNEMIHTLGLENEIVSANSYEVSPTWGHTTAGDCKNPPPYPMYFVVNYTLYDENGSAIRPMTATEIYNQARNDLQCSFLAVNHPYRGGPTFETYGITATSNPEEAEPDLNLHLVDALEIINKSDEFDRIFNQNLPAWFNLLNRGYHIAAIGGSDEHGYNGNYGNPRNYVPVEYESVGNVDPTDVFQSIKDFRSEVLAGPRITLTVDDLGLGQTVSAGETVQIHLVVEAPTWMGLNFCKVVANGEVIHECTLGTDETVLRVDETFSWTPTSDAWILAYAGSDLPEHEMTPLSSKQPLSVTNPIFIDADGNGYEAIHFYGAPWDVE